MAKAAYLDGDGQLNIGGSTAVQIITSGTAVEIEIRTDGEPDLEIQGTARAAFEIAQDGTVGIVTEVHSSDMPWYDGPTEIIPSEETQVLPTSGKGTASNIIVNPIPANYGRIAWNGTALTVY